MRSIVLAGILASCGHPPDAPPADGTQLVTSADVNEVASAPKDVSDSSQVPVTDPTTSSGQARACLPLVGGCGCADRCGDGFQQSDGSWGIVEEMADSALAPVDRRRRCFDAAGRSYPVTGAPPEASDCRDVFELPQDCGGECEPRTEFLRCGFRDGKCKP